MGLIQILEAFAQEYPFPTEALQEAQNKQAEITPYLLEHLEYLADNLATASNEHIDDAMIMYLLAFFREKKAFPFFVRIASYPENILEYFLNDITTEGLPSFLVSTFDGDIESIKKLITHNTTSSSGRSTGVNALLGIITLGAISREEVLSFYETLLDAPSANDRSFLFSLLTSMADLYPSEELFKKMMHVAKKADESDDAHISLVREIEYIRSTYTEQECLQKCVYEYKFHLPITDITSDTKWLYRKPAHDDDSAKKIVIKIKKNKSCPCNSGKKYKQCCAVGLFQPEIASVSPSL